MKDYLFFDKKYVLILPPRKILVSILFTSREFIMNISTVAVLGTGQVAIALAKGLIARGHRVIFGTRDVNGKTALDALAAVPGSRAAPYFEAAKDSDAALLATSWSGTENALKLAGADNLAGKLVIDVTNPLDFSTGKPLLVLGFPNSAGAQIQTWLPKALVVKAFNIITATRMVEPKFDDGAPDMFIAGNDAAAKAQAAELIKSFGWRSAIDMGDIDKAYLLEAMAMIWIEYGVSHNHWAHGFSLLGAKP
jgi:8-hydroxy-5-deazaflavin:NADPH oxidoreductase